MATRSSVGRLFSLCLFDVRGGAGGIKKMVWPPDAVKLGQDKKQRAMMSSAALSSKRMSCMLAKHHAISFLRCVSTLPLSCNPFLPSASRYCEDRELTRRWRRPRCDGRGDRRSIDAGTSASSSTTKRDFFYGPPSSWEAEYEELIARRNKNIVMHPLGHGQHILPGNFIVKKNPQTGAEKKVMLEHALGYFWALKVRKYAAPAHDANLRTVHVENSYVFLTFFRSPAPRRNHLFFRNYHSPTTSQYYLTGLSYQWLRPRLSPP